MSGDPRSAGLGTDHRGLVVLSQAESLRRISEAQVGRVGFFHDGDVHILPVNHVLLDGTIAFRSSWGAKLMTLTESTPASFEVDAFDESHKTGWSVLVKGIVDQIEDEQDHDRLSAASVSWLPDDAGSRWVRIRPEEISGREIRRGG